MALITQETAVCLCILFVFRIRLILQFLSGDVFVKYSGFPLHYIADHFTRDGTFQFYLQKFLTNVSQFPFEYDIVRSSTQK